MYTRTRIIVARTYSRVKAEHRYATRCSRPKPKSINWTRLPEQNFEIILNPYTKLWNSESLMWWRRGSMEIVSLHGPRTTAVSCPHCYSACISMLSVLMTGFRHQAVCLHPCCFLLFSSFSHTLRYASVWGQTNACMTSRHMKCMALSKRMHVWIQNECM